MCSTEHTVVALGYVGRNVEEIDKTVDAPA